MKITGEVIAALVSGLVGFLAGSAGGWYMLIAPADGPKGFFDINNVEILLICGFIPAVLCSALGWFACKMLSRSKESEY